MLLKNFFKKIMQGDAADQSKNPKDGQFYHEHFVDEGEDMQRIVFYRMMQLIDNEMLFLDPHLTINQIADKIGTNTSYITKLVQVFTNEAGFCEMVNRKRINFSKSMLSCRKKIPMHKIALKSGYSSASAYQYNFRKFEDVSPGVWREKNKVK